MWVLSTLVLMPRQAEETFVYEDFVNWTVISLKDFLALRGLKQSGKKAELVARAFGAYELNAPKLIQRIICRENPKVPFSMTSTINFDRIHLFTLARLMADRSRCAMLSKSFIINGFLLFYRLMILEISFYNNYLYYMLASRESHNQNIFFR